MTNKIIIFMKLKFQLFQPKLIFYISILIINYNFVISQTYTNKYFGDASINPDSLFINFEYPKIPKEIYDIIDKDIKGESSKYSFFSMTIFCSMQFDYNDSLVKIMCQPIYNFGNDIPPKHKIWKKIISNIKNIAKQWKVKKYCGK